MKKQGRALRQKEQHLRSPEGLEGVIQSGDGVIWQERAWVPVVGDEAGQADPGSGA